MQYRVLDKNENKFFNGHTLRLSPEGKLFDEGLDITEQSDIQDFLNFYDRNGHPVFIGDALTVKKEWFLERKEIYFPEMRNVFIGNHDFDELVIEITKNENGDMFYFIYFKQNGKFLTNKEMGFVEMGFIDENGIENEIRVLPMDDRGTFRFLAREKAIEISYNMTNKNKWISI